MEKSPYPTIPQDVLCHHILSRLSTKVLARFSCVCKKWRSFITSDQAFIKSHLQKQAPRNVLLFNHTYSRDRTNSGSRSQSQYEVWTQDDEGVLAMGSKNIGRRMQMVDCCDGVFCLQKPSGKHGCFDSRIFLWNPALRQRTVLPTIDTCYESSGVGFGFDDTSKEYKVIKVYTDTERHKKRLYSKVGVYSLRSHSWKTIDSKPNPMPWSWRKALHEKLPYYGPTRAIGIIHEGYFYWSNGRHCTHRGKTKAIYGDQEEGRIYLNRVHVTQSNSRERIVLPDQVPISHGYPLTIFKGCISMHGYRIRTPDQYEVWSMTDSVAATWVKHLVVKPSNLEFSNCVTRTSSRILCYPTCAVLYDMENETIDEKVPWTNGMFGPDGTCFCYIADNYVDSLGSV